MNSTLTALATVSAAFDVAPGTVLESVTKQFKEDVGTDTLTKEHTFMLQQKYGLVAPQLTLSEQNLIRREERDARTVAR